MKKLTTLCAALLFAATSFAAVEYVLPEGAVTNDYGWMDKQDMYHQLNLDWNTYSKTDVTWKTLAELMQEKDPVASGIPTQAASLGSEKNITMDIDFLSDDNFKAHFQWLVDYMVAQCAATGDVNAKDPSVDGNGAFLRYNLAAFFVNGWRSGWPVSANYAEAGKYSSFASAWKHGFDNPTEVAEGETWTLNAPYKEGETFRGWYTNPEGSGDAVTTIDHTTTGKLYACFGEYIPNVGEVLALADNTPTKMAATVSYVAGSNFWAQDATGAILCYGKDNGLTEGDVVVLDGTFKADYNGSPELADVKVVRKTAGTPLSAVEVTVANIKNDYKPYLNKLVKISGVQISRYEQSGSYTNTYISDGANELLLYKYDLKEADYPVGTVLSLKCVVSIFKETVQLRGKTEWFEIAAAAEKDNYNYPARGAAGEYTLENEWLYSVKLDNFADNRPASNGYARGMAAKDGKMYFANRELSALTVIDGATGKKLDNIVIKGEHLFQQEVTDEKTGEKSWTSAVTLAYNDIKVDNAGNVLIGACITNAQRFMIYKIDLATGEATEVINERLYDNTELGFDKIDYRFDAFGVYGDVNSKAVIMAQDAKSLNAFRWDIEDGKAQPAKLVNVKINPDTDKSYLITTTGEGEEKKNELAKNPGSAPQIFPVDFNYYYLDGNETLPTLFSMKSDIFGYTATLMDDFINLPMGLKIGNNEGDTCKLNQGHNGLVEFQVGDEYFLVMAATNTVGVPNSSFALYKFADESKSFAEMEPLWFFPNAGMGSESNGYRTAVPSVEVKDNVATIYVYTGENGYGVYTFTGKIGTGFDNIKAESDNVRKIFENGQIYILKDGVKYTVLGNVVE